MRTETRTVRIGENVGPIDWTYDFRSHFDCMGTTAERKDERCDQAKRWLKRIEDDFRAGIPIRATTYGGSPRIAIYRVLDVGMYDGWPYWRPTPSVLIDGHMGSSWHSFSSLTDVYLGSEGNETLGQIERRSTQGAAV